MPRNDDRPSCSGSLPRASRQEESPIRDWPPKRTVKQDPTWFCAAAQKAHRKGAPAWRHSKSAKVVL
jgi:hypothetical protein